MRPTAEIPPYFDYIVRDFFSLSHHHTITFNPPHPRVSANASHNLLFVVPSHMEGTFKLHKLKDDTASNVWAGKVHQYVLGLEERTIFRSGDS